MQNKLGAISGGATIFGMGVGTIVNETMRNAGQPLWLCVAGAAVVAGSIAGGLVYLVIRSAKK